MPEFLMSEHVIWHKGSSWDNMILDTSSVQELRDPTTKMKNHTFELTYAAPTIPVV